MRFAWLGAGALSLGVAGGCSTSAPPPEATSSTAQAVQGGADDPGHPFAVGLCIGPKGQCQGYCSGALIAPNVVVTARHCVDQSPKLIDCSPEAGLGPQFGARNQEMWITTSPDMMQGTTGWHRAKSVAVPTDNHVCGHDIALLVLQDLVPEAEAKPVIPGVQYYMGDDRYSTQFTAIGYGLTSPSPNPFTAGKRRIRQKIDVVCIPGDPYIPCPGKVVNENEFIGGDGTCEGDSGSSAFEQWSFDKPAGGNSAVSIGVLSRGDDSDPATCKTPVYSRLDKWRDLIVQTVTAASGNFTLYPKPVPDWTIYVPPPAPDAGPPAKKPSRALGDPCTANTDCTSNVCADSADGKLCSMACDEANAASCPDGYTCQSSLCLPAPAAAPPPPPTTTTTSSSGCAIALTSTPADGRWAAVAVSAIALAAARKRRRAT